METNILYDLMFKLESQIKNKESEIMKKSALALSEIETIIESAPTVKEIIKLEKQYDEIEKKFNQERLNQKRKIIREHISSLEKLVKHFKKHYRQELKDNFLKR